MTIAPSVLYPISNILDWNDSLTITLSGYTDTSAVSVLVNNSSANYNSFSNAWWSNSIPLSGYNNYTFTIISKDAFNIPSPATTFNLEINGPIISQTTCDTHLVNLSGKVSSITSLIEYSTGMGYTSSGIVYTAGQNNFILNNFLFDSSSKLLTLRAKDTYGNYSTPNSILLNYNPIVSSPVITKPGTPKPITDNIFNALISTNSEFISSSGNFLSDNIKIGDKAVAISGNNTEEIKNIMGVSNYQGEVKERRSTPPSSPLSGDSYIVHSPAGGAWTGKEDQIAIWFNIGWGFLTASPGWNVYVDNETKYYLYNNSTWDILDFIPNGNNFILTESFSNNWANGDKIYIYSSEERPVYTTNKLQLPVEGLCAPESKGILYSTKSLDSVKIVSLKYENFNISASTNTLVLTVNAEKAIITLNNGTGITAQQISDQINSFFSTEVSTVDSGKIILSGNYINIENASANSILGFTSGEYYVSVETTLSDEIIFTDNNILDLIIDGKNKKVIFTLNIPYNLSSLVSKINQDTASNIASYTSTSLILTCKNSLIINEDIPSLNLDKLTKEFCINV